MVIFTQANSTEVQMNKDRGKPLYVILKQEDFDNLLRLMEHIKADNMAQVVRYSLRYTCDQVLPHTQNGE